MRSYLLPLLAALAALGACSPVENVEASLDSRAAALYTINAYSGKTCGGKPTTLSGSTTSACKALKEPASSVKIEHLSTSCSIMLYQSLDGCETDFTLIRPVLFLYPDDPTNCTKPYTSVMAYKTFCDTMM